MCRQCSEGNHTTGATGSSRGSKTAGSSSSVPGISLVCQLSEFFVSILLIIGIRYVLHVHVYVYIVSVFPRKFSMHGGSVAELVHDAM